MEFWRKKNTDTRVVFPIQKSDGTFITGATGLDSEFALNGAHGAGAPSFGDCTHEATEIGTTGLYYLDVSAAELNDDYGSVIQVKSSSTGAVVQVLLFRTQVNEVNTTQVLGTAQTAGDLAALITAVDDYVDTEVGALGTELAKVPKSDSNVSLNATVLAAIADAVLARDIGSGTGAGTSEERTVRSALRALRNKTSIATGVLTVTKENDSTAAWTAAVTTDEDADPITVVDPT